VAVKLLVIGGGISGLSLAYFLSDNQDIDLTVLESEDRPGGKIWSDKSEGYLCEWGVNGFLNNKPRTIELADLLGISPLKSSDAARKRFIFSGGKLNLMPESPPAFFKSGLMSWPGKLRITMEPFISRGTRDDETLADFARRRLGREAYEKLIDPMASGIYAGDPERMSLKSCFPRIHEMEQTYGSLIRAMFKLMAERKKSVSAAPSGVLTSFLGGMQSMVDAIRAHLGGRLRTKCKVSAIERTGSGYRVHLSDASVLEAEAVVLAVPAHQATLILKELDSAVSKALDEIPYPSLAVVCTGYDRARLGQGFDAFGFLVPYREQRKVLGTLFDSSIFDGRAPDGKVLIRSMVGGARASDLARRDEKAIADTVLAEYRDILEIKVDPEFVRVYRHEKAIPQYLVGHTEKLQAVDALMERNPGLYITGNAFRGVSVNDCVENSFKLAQTISKEVA
jgi:oxygen-dependent protoporphyrinogen oxidase